MAVALSEALASSSQRSAYRLQDKLKADALKRMSSTLLTAEDYRGLFEAHVAALAATARKQYLAALEEEVRPAIVDGEGAVQPPEARGEAARSWPAAAEVLATRPCFQRLTAQEREAMWASFVRDTAAGAASDTFQALPPCVILEYAFADLGVVRWVW